MSTRAPGPSRGLSRVLLRAVVVPVLLLAAVAASLLGTRIVTANTDTREAGSVVPAEPAWSASYSRRFPGCVSAVLWPANERPVAFLLRDRSGEVRRVRWRHVVRLADHGQLGRDLTTIGACRAPR